MSEPFLSELRIMSFNFPPKGWTFANGQFLPINQNQALFSLLGTTYGGDGRQTFALPNVQGRVPIHMGSGFPLGQVGGATAHTLIISEMPAHSHPLMTDATTTSGITAQATSTSVLGRSSGAITPTGSFTVQMYNTAAPGTTLKANTISNVGGSQPHTNMQPYLALSFCIALQGIFPSQN
jgi:microcystin-dependent protein